VGDANAAVLLHIVLMMQICLCAIHVQPNIVMEMFPIQHPFSLTVLYGTCCLKPFHIFEIVQLEKVHQETFVCIFDDTGRTVIIISYTKTGVSAMEFTL